MNSPKVFIVNVPVTDLRREPSGASQPGVEDPLQETQLLLGEPLLGRERRDGWVFVHAPNQPYLHQDGSWSGYPGWVREADIMETGFSQEDSLVVEEHGAALEVGGGSLYLSKGTFLEFDGETGRGYKVLMPDDREGVIDKSCCRMMTEPPVDRGDYLVEMADSFVGMPYLWGGRSSHMPESKRVTSVDCSGLIHMIHAMVGLVVPRNAHDQYERCMKIEAEELEPGDLVFLSKLEKPGRMTHVMLYEGDEVLIEASSGAGKVQRVSSQEKWGKALHRLKHGDQLANYFVYFGSYLKS